MNELAISDTRELSPEQLGGEIRLLTTQARRMALSYGIQIGYRLHIAHEKVGPHGWAEWLKKETDFSAASASRFESLYEGGEILFLSCQLFVQLFASVSMFLFNGILFPREFLFGSSYATLAFSFRF